ncbi:MAG: sulfatase-like hydrolase/transferase [Sedimenticolaceae bacterium]
MTKVALALLLLNFLTSFTNVWPTPFVQPDTRIGPEFVALWVILILLVALFGRVGRGAIAVLTGWFLLVAIGRYVDVTVPAWLGRKLNLYWDAVHLPKFLEVASQGYAWWQILGIIAAFIAGFWLLTRLIRACIEVLAEHAAPYTLRSPMALIVTVSCLGLVVANLTQVVASPYVSGPVFPVYKRQADLLLAPILPGRLESMLPESPPLDSDLKVLEGADIKVVFLESYGATTYERDEIARVIGPARERLEQSANAQGRQVLSAFVRAAAFGGASDLSHLSLLSGIDLTDPIRHDLLLTTERPTMLDTFEQAGYQTIGLYPAMSWEWPEKSFYDFDHYHDAPSLDYRGPKFGLWWLPDQFSMARIDELYPPDPDGKPRFLFFPTITSHIPFRPTPPYQPDWSRVTSDKPYSDEATAEAMADEIDWNTLLPAYINTIEYTFNWLAGYQALPQPRESVLILLGDHQPAGGITGPNASWDVPVHIITSNDTIAERLRIHGFKDGVNPRRESLGHISELSQILLSVFDSGQSKVADAASSNSMPK